MDNKLTIINKNERTGRSYTFYFNKLEDKKFYEETLNTLKENSISNFIKILKSKKDLYSKLEYKILGVDKAVDIITYQIKENKIIIPLIERIYEPLGLALPGGFIDENETEYEAAKRELKEELNIEPLNDLYSKTKFYNGIDENGKLYDSRGEITTIGYIFEIDNETTFKAGDDAKDFKLIEIDLNKDLKEQINEYNFAMERHKLILSESLDIIEKNLNVDIKNLSIN